MRKQIHRLMLILFLALFTTTSASAQERCVPFGGTVYGWHTDNWYANGDFTVGRNVRHANIVDVNTGLVDRGSLTTGSEVASFDFASGDTVQLNTDFIVEHMKDALAASGVYDVKANGTFVKGTGKFKGAYGHFVMEGSFGPAVKLPDSIHPDPKSDMSWMGWYHGMMCGVRGS